MQEENFLISVTTRSGISLILDTNPEKLKEFGTQSGQVYVTNKGIGVVIGVAAIENKEQLFFALKEDDFKVSYWKEAKIEAYTTKKYSYLLNKEQLQLLLSETETTKRTNLINEISNPIFATSNTGEDIILGTFSESVKEFNAILGQACWTDQGIGVVAGVGIDPKTNQKALFFALKKDDFKVSSSIDLHDIKYFKRGVKSNLPLNELILPSKELTFEKMQFFTLMKNTSEVSPETIILSRSELQLLLNQSSEKPQENYTENPRADLIRKLDTSITRNSKELLHAVQTSIQEALSNLTPLPSFFLSDEKKTEQQRLKKSLTSLTAIKETLTTSDSDGIDNPYPLSVFEL